MAKIRPMSHLPFTTTKPKAYVKITLLAPLIQLLPAEKFEKMANELESNKYSKGIDSWTHSVTMLYLSINPSKKAAIGSPKISN